MTDLDPCYCIRCRKQIPRELSDNQGVCEECRAALEDLAAGSLGAPPRTDRPPPCPRCGSDDVEREWVTDWLARAVDVVTGIAGLGLDLLTWENRIGNVYMGPPRGSRATDPVTESGPVRVLRYHCRRCNERWKPN